MHAINHKHDFLIQGMYILSNVASGNEHHKEAVMSELFSQTGSSTESILAKFLQSSNSQLRTAAVWAVVNLTLPSSPGACGRVTEFWNEGIVSHLKNMVNDPCLDVKVSNTRLYIPVRRYSNSSAS